MIRKVRSLLIHSFVMIVLVATTLSPNNQDREINSTRADQKSQISAVAPPLVLAQGRCFNGRCY